jgi:hypothetical protein
LSHSDILDFSLDPSTNNTEEPSILRWLNHHRLRSSQKGYNSKQAICHPIQMHAHSSSYYESPDLSNVKILFRVNVMNFSGKRVVGVKDHKVCTHKVVLDLARSVNTLRLMLR